MKLLENLTTSNHFSRAALGNWLLALLVIGATAVLIYSAQKEEEDRTSQPRKENPALAEPQNPLAEERGVMKKPEPAPRSPGRTYYVKPTGSDEASGRTQEEAFKTIQKAVDSAQPGEVIVLADGTYMQDFVSRRDGTPESRIILEGSPQAVIKGGGGVRIIEINHDYLTLQGFTVDGLAGDPEKEKGYRDKLIYVQGQDPSNGVTGLRILGMTLQNAGGECIRLRYFAEKNEIAHNTIRACGAYDFALDDDEDGKNGEGVYIGTAPEQRKDGNNPTKDMDASRANWVHHNHFDTQGNECVDIKEGSEQNIVEHNTCTGQKDKESGGMGSRGNENIFRFNEIYGNRGAGIRVGGDKKEQGINNFLYQNTIRNNEEGGIKIMRKPQAKICGNVFSSNKEGELVGEYGEDFDNPKACQ